MIDLFVVSITLTGAVLICAIGCYMFFRYRQRNEVLLHQGTLSRVGHSSNRGLLGTPDERNAEQDVVFFEDGASYAVKNGSGLDELSGLGVEVRVIRKKGFQIARVVRE